MDGPRPGPRAGSSVDDVLEHYGVRGMRWGKRKKSSGGTSSKSTSDAKNVASSRSKVKTGGTKTLTTPELQALVTRMNLEQQYSNLVGKEATNISHGKNFVKGLLATSRNLNEIVSFPDSPTGKLIRKHLS